VKELGDLKNGSKKKNQMVIDVDSVDDLSVNTFEEVDKFIQRANRN
jgi:hypothetical protein